MPPTVAGNANETSPFQPTFGDRLRALLLERNLSAAELARLIQTRVPRFSAGNVSHYLCERSFPRPPILNIISEILQTDLRDCAKRRVPASKPPFSAVDAQLDDNQVSVLHLTDTGDGGALLHFNQKVSWSLALKILQTIRGAD